MKIFIISEDVYHTRRWVTALAQHDNSIFLFSLGKIVNQALYQQYPNVQYYSANVAFHSIYNVGEWHKLKYLSALRILKKQIKDFYPDIVHAHYATSNGLLGVLSGFHPLIVSVWGSDVYQFPRKSILHKLLFKYILKVADVILSTSNIMANEIKKYTDKKIAITPFGVDLSVFRKSAEKINSLPIIIGNIKALESHYGIDTLIKSFSLLLQKGGYRDIKLVIIGEGSKKEELIDLGRSLGCIDKISFLGKIDNSLLPEYYNSFTVFVSLSNSESFGVVAVEAMACECPVVVSDADGFLEVVENEKTGIIVPKNDPNAAAVAIQTLIDNPLLRRKFGKNGRERVLRFYDWTNNVNTMVAIYKNIIDSYEDNSIS